MTKKYTTKFLISELYRFTYENGRSPTATDMQFKRGYPSNEAYVRRFGSWNEALKNAGLEIWTKKYTEEFLISELRRFAREQGRSPRRYEIRGKNGYPSNATYDKYFGNFNNALKSASLKLNKTNIRRTGKETCIDCGNTLHKNQQWITKGLQNDEVMCMNCYERRNTDHKTGNLDVESSTGFAFISQRVVAKTLGLELKNDCNCSINFSYPYDLLDKNKYGKINVKVSKLRNNHHWEFILSNKHTPDTYIFVGFDQGKKDVLRVWIFNPNDRLIYKKGSFIITNTHSRLKRAKPWEVDPKPYNNAFHAMSIENCSVLTYKE